MFRRCVRVESVSSPSIAMGHCSLSITCSSDQVSIHTLVEATSCAPNAVPKGDIHKIDTKLIEDELIASLVHEARNRAGKAKICFEVLEEGGGKRDEGMAVIITRADWARYQFITKTKTTSATCKSHVLASIVFTLASMMNVSEEDTAEILALASCQGGAGHGIYGGITKWDKMGLPQQLVPKDHWDDLRMIIVVPCFVAGMTPLPRAPTVGPCALKAILGRDITAVGIAMQQGAEVMETWRRWCVRGREQGTGYGVMLAVGEALRYHNSLEAEVQAAYAFDVMGNPVVFTVQRHLPKILKLLISRMPPSEAAFHRFCSPAGALGSLNVAQTYDDVLKLRDEAALNQAEHVLKPGAVSQLWIAQPGQAAQVTSIRGRLKDA